MGYFEDLAEHNRRVKDDPIYRLEGRIAEIEANSIPSYDAYSPGCETIKTSDKATVQSITQPIPARRFQQLEARVLHLENKQAEHIALSRKFRKDGAPKYK